MRQSMHYAVFNLEYIKCLQEIRQLPELIINDIGLSFLGTKYQNIMPLAHVETMIILYFTVCYSLLLLLESSILYGRRSLTMD